MSKRPLPKHVDRMLKEWARKQRRACYVLQRDEVVELRHVVNLTINYLDLLEDAEIDDDELLAKHKALQKVLTKAWKILGKLT